MIYFVTAINTNSGKTLVSSIFAQALQADYWKPIQAGLPTDLNEAYKLIKNPVSRFHPETYRLLASISPHAAAKAEKLNINLDKIKLPEFQNDLVIEGAGGVLTPLNDTDFIIDLAAKFDAEVILVSDVYLGSINHTILTANELSRRNVNVRGIVFNRAGNTETEDIILKHTGYECLLKIENEDKISSETIDKYAKKLKFNLFMKKF